MGEILNPAVINCLTSPVFLGLVGSTVIGIIIEFSRKRNITTHHRIDPVSPRKQ